MDKKIKKIISKEKGLINEMKSLLKDDVKRDKKFALFEKTKKK